MTDISRRKYLGVTAALGVTGLSGCLSEQIGINNDDGEKNEYSEINDIRVKQTPDGYNQDADYFAVVSENIQDEYNIEKHQQLRLRIQADSQEQWRLRPSLFTAKVEPDFAAEEDDTIWLSNGGLDRISAKPEMIIAAMPFAPSPNIDTQETARENNEFIEQSVTKEDELLSCASSGGEIYENTDLQALHVSSESTASSWACFGYDDKDRAHERWHVRPELIYPDSYNDVRFLIEDEEHESAVNFIGIDGGADGQIIIGGLASETLQEDLKANLEEKFEGQDVDISIAYGGRWSGTDTKNIVNRFTETGDNGLQVAQSEDIRQNHWKKVADAVLETYGEQIEYSTPTPTEEDA